MRGDLSPDQRALADFMSEISEKAYYAGWMHDLEFDLWRAVKGGPTDYGRAHISKDTITRLRELSDVCAGWIVFDDHEEEKWLPISDWKRLFSERRKIK